MHFRETSNSQTRRSASAITAVTGTAPAIGPASVLEWCSLLVATLTVCVLPWLLGGAIPKARLALQTGAIAAAILTLLARLIARRSFALPPLGTWLLLGLAAIGIVQLQPWMPSAISQMNHAVHPEYRDHLPQVATGVETAKVANTTAANSWSVAPALTRQRVAQWIAVAVLLCVVADSLSQSRQLVCVLWLLCVNAAVLTVLSLLQLFDTGSRGLSAPWIISNSMPFGSFVNPNNAAGWLLVHLAFAIGLAVIKWSRNPVRDQPRLTGRAAWRDHVFESVVMARHRIATLEIFQILSMVIVVLLVIGVAATLSRSGIIAGFFCLFVAAVSRMQWRKSLLLLLPLAILLAAANIFLTAFELDTLVFAELSTLKDPVSESTIRVLHWADSVVSIRDFPMVGSGQGTYAYATLPYQRRGGSSWFMNADNQYVEVLVESGLLGFALFAGFGILLTVFALQLILRKSGHRTETGLSSHRIAIGMAAMAMIASQAIVAFFDFGIGLPSTMAAIAIFGGVLTAVRRSQPTPGKASSSVLGFDGVAVPWLLRVALVAAACGSVNELWQADRAYPAIVESARILQGPVTRKSLQRLPQLGEVLTEGLRNRPDDPVVLDSLVRVMEAQYRLAVVDSLTPTDEPMDDPELQIAWQSLTPLALAERLILLRDELDAESFRRIQTQLQIFSDKFPWHKLARQAAQRMPLSPGLAVDAAAGATGLGQLDELQFQELTAVLFTDPAGARRLYQCGLVCLIANRPEQAIDYWHQSLSASESYRTEILEDALRNWTHEQSLSLFAPQEFAATVHAAFSISDPRLQEGLWRIANAQWEKAASAPNADQRIQRAHYLVRKESSEAALAWIDECLVQLPASLELRRMRAESLEKQGKFQEAISEWTRYQHFDPKSSLPAASIDRLSAARFE